MNIDKLYKEYLEHIDGGVTHGEQLSVDLNKQEFQSKMMEWWDRNQMDEVDMKRLLNSKYRKEVQDRFVAMTSEGKRLEDEGYERPLGLY